MRNTATVLITVLLVIAMLLLGILVVHKKNADREKITFPETVSEPSAASQQTDTAEFIPEYAASETQTLFADSGLGVTVPPVADEGRTTAVAPTTASVPEQTTKQASGWKAAYREFYQRKGFADSFISDSDGAELGLRDMDNDGIPELLVSDPYDGGTYGHGYIFTYAAGSVVLAGTSDSYGGQWGPHTVSDSRYPGIFTHIWYRGEYDKPNGMPFHLIYCYLENHEVKSVDVAADYTVEGQYEQITDDTGLYNAVVGSDGKDNFELITDTDLNAMGWDAFCAKYGY